jgi:transcriptional regulator with XRE-family HTH domain
MLTSEQIRAARALLGWPARELAQRAGVHVATVQRMERARGALHGTVASLTRIERALTAAGIEFIEDDAGVGVRLRQT